MTQSVNQGNGNTWDSPSEFLPRTLNFFFEPSMCKENWKKKITSNRANKMLERKVMEFEKTFFPFFILNGKPHSVHVASWARGRVMFEGRRVLEYVCESYTQVHRWERKREKSSTSFAMEEESRWAQEEGRRRGSKWKRDNEKKGTKCTYSSGWLAKHRYSDMDVRVCPATREVSAVTFIIGTEYRRSKNLLGQWCLIFSLFSRTCTVTAKHPWVQQRRC